MIGKQLTEEKKTKKTHQNFHEENIPLSERFFFSQILNNLIFQYKYGFNNL